MILKSNLNKIVETIVESVHPEKIILFGSRIRGDYKRGSDYDFLIVKSGVKNEREISKRIYRALFEHKICEAVDIVVVSPGKLRINKKNPFLIYSWAIKEGRVLYG